MSKIYYKYTKKQSIFIKTLIIEIKKKKFIIFNLTYKSKEPNLSKKFN